MEKDPLKDLNDKPVVETVHAIPAPSGESTLIDTDYVIGQDNVKGQFSFSLDIHGKVFTISAITILVFVFLTLALQNEVAPLFGALRGWLTSNLAWFFIGAANIFVILCLVLIVSPLGKVRLGGMEAKAEIGRASCRERV